MRKLLVVDDEVMVNEVVEDILSDLADKVLTATNANDAKIIIETHPDLDCVVSDINMKEMNGIEFLENIRSDKNEIPFIFYTGYGDEETIKKALQLNAYDFVHKPDFTVLLDSIQSGYKNNFTKNDSNSFFSSSIEDLTAEYSELQKDLD